MILFGYTRIKHNSGLLLSLDTIGYFWDAYPNLNVFFVSPRCMSLNKRDEPREPPRPDDGIRSVGFWDACDSWDIHWREGGEFSQRFQWAFIVPVHSPRLIPKTSMYWQTSSHFGTVFDKISASSDSSITNHNVSLTFSIALLHKSHRQKSSNFTSPHPKDLDHHCHETFVMARIGWKGHDSPAKVAAQLSMQAVM